MAVLPGFVVLTQRCSAPLPLFFPHYSLVLQENSVVVPRDGDQAGKEEPAMLQQPHAG